MSSDDYIPEGIPSTVNDVKDESTFLNKKDESTLLIKSSSKPKIHITNNVRRGRTVYVNKLDREIPDVQRLEYFESAGTVVNYKFVTPRNVKTCEFAIVEYASRGDAENLISISKTELLGTKLLSCSWSNSFIKSGQQNMALVCVIIKLT